jgi:hypothetical protein
MPTTPANMDALRELRHHAHHPDLEDNRRLTPSRGIAEREGLRGTFEDRPPFEL